MRRLSSCFCIAILGCLISNSAEADILTYIFTLDGSQEVGAGDPDGTGTATVMIDDVALTIDWNFVVANIDLPLTGAHIHNAPAGVNGPVVVNFANQLSGSGLNDPDLAAVVANPTNFYVNLHNAAFPGGAIRGQFTQAIPEPGSASVLVLMAAGFVMSRRRNR